LSPDTFQSQTDFRKKGSSPSSWLAISLIIGLGLVNLLLIRQNFGLRKQLANHGMVDATPSALKPGEIVTSIVGTDLAGLPYQLDYKKDGRRHLVLFFSPSCAYCVQQAPLWRKLLNEVDSTRFSVVGIVGARENKKAVSTHAEELGYFRTRTSLPVVFLNDEALARYKLTATPTTLLINDDGKVERAWVGTLDELKMSEVANALR
jgi:thiol-disulfide isomerase/thioredoxin